MLTWVGQRNRLATMVMIAGLAGICWAYLGKMIWDMSVMPMESMAMATSPASIKYGIWLAVMWFVMMTAMMLPSATPMTLVFADFSSDDAGRMNFELVSVFVGGYVLAWSVFSVFAALVQWVLELGAVVSPLTMALKSNVAAGLVLIAAGLYQWTPLKNACLRKCRTPFGFLMTEWRDGIAGALRTGWRYGCFCIGCCWALMSLLFVAGVMSPLWIIVLALFVIVEKAAPFGNIVSRAIGTGLAGLGIWLALS